MNKIIITGASGFVGQNLQKYLRDFGNEIIPLSIRYKQDQDQDFILEGDIIIHLAGKAHDVKKVTIPSEYYEANFELTKQVFDAFLGSQVKVFIFMSTVKAVADTVEGVLTEDIIPNPQTHYGIAKYKAEQYILSQQLPSNKRVYILRPCMIHGPGNKGNLNLLYKTVQKGFPWPLGAFYNQRSFLSIENLCFIIKEIVERDDFVEGIYNLADDDALSINELIEIIAECIGKKAILLKIPRKVIIFLALLGNKLHLPLNSERLQKLTESYVVSNQKLVQVLGKSLPVQTREGIENTLKSFKNVY